MEGASVGAAALSASPVSPASSRHGNGTSKRKRSSVVVGPDSSPGSFIDDGHEHNGEHDKKRQPGVKRACNECRQQKLRCDVVQDPFQSCSRCNRLALQCKIESNFKRVGKRSKHAEMEKEIERLRRNVARARAQGYLDDDEVDNVGSPSLPARPTTTANTTNTIYTHARNPSLMGSNEAVSSLLHLKRGGSYPMPTQPPPPQPPPPQPRYPHELEDVRLTDHHVSQLFHEFFTFYHTFLPFLSPQQPPDQYKLQHPLLFWSIVAVAARRFSPADGPPKLLANLSGPMTRYLWTTIGEVPSNHHVVKAMCLLCAWPLPTSTTTSDPTHILCGVMMKTATGIGLHRPNHIRDFSRVSVELNKEQLRDRVTTWAVCNIVAQSVGTGYGQPASTLYDWTLALRPGDDPALHLAPELEARLQIERFCDKVSKEMYSNASDPRGVAGDEHRAMLMRVYRRDYGEINASVLSQKLGPVVNLHLRAAGLHLRLAGFFDSSNTPGYLDDLMGLWRAAVGFLDELLGGGPDTPAADHHHLNHPHLNHHHLNHHQPASPRRDPPAAHGLSILPYATNYLQQMLVAAAFTLLKLMRSFFSRNIDFARGRNLFHHAIRAIRATSVVHNDLQWRLAELMVQMWNGARLDSHVHLPLNCPDDAALDLRVDDSLQLKVRCRHSMSLVFDSVWRWREEYQAQGRGSLDNTKQPTNPDSANESSASSTQLDSTLLPSHLPAATNNLINANGALTQSAAGLSATASGPNAMIGGGMSYGDAGYDFFDPQHWMLDGLVDFNYSFVPPLEGA